MKFHAVIRAICRILGVLMAASAATLAWLAGHPALIVPALIVAIVDVILLFRRSVPLRTGRKRRPLVIPRREHVDG